MNEGRVYFGIANCTESSIMVCGGYDGEKVLNSCEVFHTGTGVWEKIGNIN